MTRCVVRQFRTAHDLQPVIDAMSDVAIRAPEVSEVNGNRWNTNSSIEGYKVIRGCYEQDFPQS